MSKEKIIGTKKQRQTRIGGSEFASVLDINPYKKRIELVLEKAGVIIDTFEGNEATRRGEALENDIIAMFEDETGLSVKDEQAEFTLEPSECLPLVCHVDGITSDDAVFEAKTTDIKSKVWSEGIPEYYKAQLEFNCALARKTKAYIAVGYCKGNEVEKFEYYEYTPKYSIDDIVKNCYLFTLDVKHYAQMGVLNNGKVINSNIDERLIEKLEEINERIAEIKKEIKPLEDEKKIIEDMLKKEIGINKGFETLLYKVSMSNRIVSPCNEYKISRSGLKIERKEV